jgi:hypothetical protein
VFSLKVKKVVACNKSASSHGNKDINAYLAKLWPYTDHALLERPFSARMAL